MVKIWIIESSYASEDERNGRASSPSMVSSLPSIHMYLTLFFCIQTSVSLSEEIGLIFYTQSTRGFPWCVVKRTFCLLRLWAP